MGRPTGAAPARRSSQDRMLAVTSRPPFESDPPAGAAPAWSPLREECIADLCHGGMRGAKAPYENRGALSAQPPERQSEMVLPRGLAPRTSAFAERRASLTLRELEKWCAMPVLPRRPRFGRPPCFCYTNDALKMVAVFGIAPNSPRLQRGANLSQLHSQWSLRAVSRRGLSLIGRGLCF